MKITTARRLAQIVFFGLFVWLCLVATVGTGWMQWRGWPIGWFLQLDPLAAAGIALTTHSLPPALGWSLLTIALTLLFGRVFCGFVCPFGAIHQFVGWLGRRVLPAKVRIAANAYRPAQALKYYLLIFLLAAAALSVGSTAGLLQIGLLDPIPLLYRSFNLVLLPAADLGSGIQFPGGRFVSGGALLAAVFLLAVLANLWVPRFFCRFLCPLGALLGVFARRSLWGIGRTAAKCTECSLCDVDCEGACNPQGPIHVGECLMCMNCFDTCPTAQPLAYVPRPSSGGEVTSHGITRRGFVGAAVTGLAVAPLARLGGMTGTNWSPALIRPPGSVAESEFLARCLKCDACVRVCPTNALQPAGVEHGWEALWTPVLNNRIGTSGCQHNCIACGQACPVGAIRPLTFEEKHGQGDFTPAGPIRIGLAQVDRGRCLPWAMERPCIVCEENCPVTPKAIYVSEITQTIRDGTHTLTSVEGTTLQLKDAGLTPGRFASGDYACKLAGEDRALPITANTADSLTLDSRAAPAEAPAAGTIVEIQVRLQRPVVDPARCIGCGICEHECPINGLRAIRVTADNETRDPAHAALLNARSNSTPKTSQS